MAWTFTNLPPFISPLYFLLASSVSLFVISSTVFPILALVPTPQHHPNSARHTAQVLVILLSPVFPVSHPPPLLCVLSLPRHDSPGEVSSAVQQLSTCASTRWVPSPFANSRSTGKLARHRYWHLIVTELPTGFLGAGRPAQHPFSHFAVPVLGVGSREPACRGSQPTGECNAVTRCHSSSSSRRYSWPPSQREQELKNIH